MTHILIVDDHAIVRTGIRRLLKDRGATEILEAASGEDALQTVQEAQLDLVVLDLNLPSLGGLELLKRLMRVKPDLAILVFSQHAEDIYAAKALEASRRQKAIMQGYTGNMCSECQNFTMVRNGTCEKCDTCGSTSGCS